MATVSYCAGMPLSGDGKSQPANALIGQLLGMGFGIRIYTSAGLIGLIIFLLNKP